MRPAKTASGQRFVDAIGVRQRPHEVEVRAPRLGIVRDYVAEEGEIVVGVPPACV